MRVSAALASAAVAAATTLPVAASAVPAPPGWVRGERSGLVSVVSVQSGALAGHDGNWHTVVLGLTGADGVSGVLTDWSCPDGVTPDYQSPGPDWVCVQNAVSTIDDAVDEDGTSLVTVSLNRTVRNLVVDGTVQVTAADGTMSTARLHLVAHAYGELARTVVDSADGLTRQVIEERSDVVARGRIAGVRLHRRGAENSASGLVAVTTWTRPGTSRPSFG